MDNLDTEALEQIGQGAAVREDEENNQGAAPEVVFTDAQKWAAIPQVLGSVLCMAMPELKPAYSEQNCNNWGEAMVPLAEKHGWNPDSAVGPELGVAAASLSFVVPTGLVIMRRRKAAREAARLAAEKAAAERQTRDAGPPVAAPIAGDGKTPATNPDAQVFGTS